MARLLLDTEQAGRFRCTIASRSTRSSSRSPKAKALVLVTFARSARSESASRTMPTKKLSPTVSRSTRLRTAPCTAKSSKTIPTTSRIPVV